MTVEGTALGAQAVRSVALARFAHLAIAASARHHAIALPDLFSPAAVFVHFARDAWNRLPVRTS